jgi:hypothetical protein
MKISKELQHNGENCPACVALSAEMLELKCALEKTSLELLHAEDKLLRIFGIASSQPRSDHKKITPVTDEEVAALLETMRRAKNVGLVTSTAMVGISSIGSILQTIEGYPWSLSKDRKRLALALSTLERRGDIKKTVIINKDRKPRENWVLSE